jgi:hypothetical protein
LKVELDVAVVRASVGRNSGSRPRRSRVPQIAL